MRSFLIAALAASTLTACQSDSANTQNSPANETSQVASAVKQAVSETERLNNWFAEKYEERLQESPLMLTFLGRKDKNDEFNLMSREETKKDLAWQVATAKELKNKFDYNKLDKEAKTSYDIWLYQVEQAVAAEKFYKNSFIFNMFNNAD